MTNSQRASTLRGHLIHSDPGPFLHGDFSVFKATLSVHDPLKIAVMTARRSYPTDLSDARWALIEPVLAAWRAARAATGVGPQRAGA